MTDEWKTPHKVATEPKKKLDLNTITFELRLPWSVVLDALNALKLQSEKFMSSFNVLNEYIAEGVKSHIKLLQEKEKDSSNEPKEVEETETK